MKNSKNKRTAILALILVGLLFVAYKVMFVSPVDDMVAEENVAAGERGGAILREVESINFDVSVITDPRFKSLQSIEIPLPSLPVGKKNPFSASAN